MNIVLMEPEIPQNTGNIGRSCVATGTKLHLIKPLGFEITDKMVKRAGMDYWKDVELFLWENLEELLKSYPKSNFYFATTKTDQKYSDVKYGNNDFIIFGPESRGIPEKILNEYKEFNITIPMKKGTRSLNLSNSVGIVLYEALRQNDFSFGD